MKRPSNRCTAWVCAIIVGLVTCSQARAHGFCSEPLEPYCVTGVLSAAAAKPPAEVLECRLHLQQYLKKVVQYQRCLLDLSAETAGLIRDKRRLLDCDHNADLCDGIPAP